jgi:hypothetical protein
MMNALKLTIIILVTCLTFAGCGPLHRKTDTDKPPVEEDIRLGTGITTLAEDLEKAKPLVDLNLEDMR